MARFRGIDKMEFIDQRQIRGPAFNLLEEAELFCQRHFPLPGKIVSGKLQRIDTPLIPPEAMREILVNALIHRDYSIAGGAVSLAIFDDRVEVWSAGTYPKGITPEALSRNHLSIQRNPIIAEVFYRAGLIEKWGRGTNRVIAACLKAGLPPPEFAEVTGAAVVTLRVNVAATPQVTTQVTTQAATQATTQATTQVIRMLQAARTPCSLTQLQLAARLKNRVHFLKAYLEPSLTKGWIVRTIPEKPRSPQQRYLITQTGEDILAARNQGKAMQP